MTVDFDEEIIALEAKCLSFEIFDRKPNAVSSVASNALDSQTDKLGQASSKPIESQGVHIPTLRL